jgi:exodeoxyribonuclease VII small subunit
MAGASESPEDLPFERALERLEAIVARLEQGDLALEEALAVFEEGVALSRRCAAQLDAAERRVEVLVREGQALAARPLAAGAEREGDD